jgi:ketosteroid isomerase-like protein
MEMSYDQAREVFLHLWRHTANGDEAKAHELYHDDAILEFPQSGERFLGKANMQGFREQYGAQTGVAALDFEPREIRGDGDVWIGEGRARYDGGDPIHFVHILELRDGLVRRETIYFADPFPAPDWRTPWAEKDAAWEPQGGLPANIRGGG